jgi:hypothetical protein
MSAEKKDFFDRKIKYRKRESILERECAIRTVKHKKRKVK